MHLESGLELILLSDYDNYAENSSFFFWLAYDFENYLVPKNYVFFF